MRPKDVTQKLGGIVERYLVNNLTFSGEYGHFSRDCRSSSRREDGRSGGGRGDQR